MSYVVQIWDNPVNKPFPVSIDAALQLLETLQSCQLSEFNPKFIALAERLKQRYPDMDSVPFDEDGDDDFDLSELAWTDSPLNGKTFDAVYGLGLNLNDLFDEVRPFVMQEAAELGLCVMDEQAGEVYLPDGNVLRMPGKTTPASSTIKQPTNEEVLDIVFERLAPLMLEHGYTAYKNKHLFKQIHPESWCEIMLWSPGCYGLPLFAELGIVTTLRCHAISDLICEHAYPDKSLEDVAKMSTLSLNSDKWIEGTDEFEVGGMGGRYYIKRFEQIDAVVAQLTMKLQAYLLPALAQYKTLSSFEYHFNTLEEASSLFEIGKFGYGMVKIIAAYLAGNPGLEALCEGFYQWAQEQTGRYQHNGAPEILRCIDYVRSHPRPTTQNK
ncbi:MAG: hypothetical protein PHH59_04145 [Methylovulum sp.]|uniref:hypothetical protein n=1 Tax=Methylovulum sp. TaxID=1916980 RepID=UPI0026373730|nr:hypothetical protein [Methylovulum sp.]MDD2723200.1 hypothetical protein [Methylovulum sp.]MDD5123141.1 hypothetical protein [Methylovulum sp.]